MRNNHGYLLRVNNRGNNMPTLKGCKACQRNICYVFQSMLSIQKTMIK